MQNNLACFCGPASRLGYTIVALCGEKQKNLYSVS